MEYKEALDVYKDCVNMFNADIPPPEHIDFEDKEKMLVWIENTLNAPKGLRIPDWEINAAKTLEVAHEKDLAKIRRIIKEMDLTLREFLYEAYERYDKRDLIEMYIDAEARIGLPTTVMEMVAEQIRMYGSTLDFEDDYPDVYAAYRELSKWGVK